MLQEQRDTRHSNNWIQVIADISRYKTRNTADIKKEYKVKYIQPDTR